MIVTRPHASYSCDGFLSRNRMEALEMLLALSIAAQNADEYTLSAGTVN